MLTHHENCYEAAFFLVWIQAHPWFKGVQWDKLYEMEAAFIPEVNGDLDTQNFEEVIVILFPFSTV